jgi:hypothetical protein
MNESILCRQNMLEHRWPMFLFWDEARSLNIPHGKLASFQRKGSTCRVRFKMHRSYDQGKAFGCILAVQWPQCYNHTYETSYLVPWKGARLFISYELSQCLHFGEDIFEPGIYTGKPSDGFIDFSAFCGPGECDVGKVEKCFCVSKRPMRRRCTRGVQRKPRGRNGHHRKAVIRVGVNKQIALKFECGQGDAFNSSYDAPVSQTILLTFLTLLFICGYQRLAAGRKDKGNAVVGQELPLEASEYTKTQGCVPLASCSPRLLQSLNSFPWSESSAHTLFSGSHIFKWEKWQMVVKCR